MEMNKLGIVKREANAAQQRDKPGAGVPGLDMYAMRGPLEQLGLRHAD